MIFLNNCITNHSGWLSSKKLHYTVFIFGCLLFIIFKVGFISLSTLARSQPVEIDDSYVYTWKSVKLIDCFNNDCIAQKDLRNQLFPQTDNILADKVRKRVGPQLFAFINPLHSLILTIIHQLGLSWVSTYKLVVIIGAFFICAALAYWLAVTWGFLIAGMSLAYFATVIYSGQGFQTVVPSNLTLGIGALMWGRILQSGKDMWLSLPIFTIMAVMMHPIGNIYSSIALGMYILVVGQSISWKNVICILVTGAILITAFLTPHLVDNPMINYNKFISFQNYSWFSGIKANILVVMGSLFSGLLIRNLIIIIIGVTCFFIVRPSISDSKRHQLDVTGLLLGFIVVVSFFYVLPGYPAELFYRIWIPVSFFFFGACAVVLYKALELAINLVTSDKKKAVRYSNFNERKDYGRYSWQNLLIIVLGIVILGGFVKQIYAGTPELLVAFKSRLNRHAYNLDDSHPAELLKKSLKDDKVLYTDEIPFLFYLVNEAHKLGAVYYPAIKNTSIESRWMKKIDYIVAWNNPYRQITRERYPSALRLTDINSITYESEIFEKLEKLKIYVLNPGRAFNVDVLIPSRDSFTNYIPALTIHVPEGYKGWLSSIPRLSGQFINKLRLVPQKANKKAELLGLGFSKRNGSSLWPWKQRAKVRVSYTDKKTVLVRFDVLKTLGDKNLQAHYKNKTQTLQVIKDSGSLVLLKNTHTGLNMKNGTSEK